MENNGTPFGEVFLDFQANMTGVNLMGKETLIFQAFKRSLAICRKTLTKNLGYLLDKRVYTLRIFEMSDRADRITVSINGAAYSADTSPADKSEGVLRMVLTEIEADYPLSRIIHGVLSIRSDEDIEVELTESGSFTIILQPSYDGRFLAELTQDEISLIAVGMTKEWYNMQHSKVLLERSNMGTKHFDKDPDRKKQYESIVERSNYWNFEFMRYRQEFAAFGY